MADDPPRQPVVLRIKVRYATADAFVERFAPYVARAGLFLRSKTPKPVGTEVRFELRLSDDQPVLVGMGVVRWSRDPDPDKPYTPPGMAIEFTRVTKESRGVILKMLELRRALGMHDGPRGLPAPPDDDVAIVAATTASATAAAVAAEAPVMMTGPIEAVIAVVTAPIAAPTAPAWERPAAPAVLEPLAARARRPGAAELVASMTTQAGGAGGTPLQELGDAFGDLDAQDADVEGVLARARAMVGHDLDGELANLLDQDAAPVAISIDEASAGLASLFGTAPVSRRNRRADDSVRISARPSFAAPPPVAAPAAVASVAASITDDLFAPIAPEPADTAVDAIDPDADADARAAEAVAAAAAAVAAQREISPDPERTRVVSLAAYAAMTQTPPEGATRVVSLDALAATSVRDPDERTEDDDRTRVALRPAVDDDARTRVVSMRELDRARARDDGDETLDFDRKRPVPRDFADEPEVDTSVRARPSRTVPPPPPPRPKGRTLPPPPPARRPTQPRAASPAQAPLDDDSHDEDLTPPPVSVGESGPIRLPRAESSGSFDLDDLVAELNAESAAPVAIQERSALDGLGRSLAGDALDADGIMADLDGIGRRRAPDGPFPDLASFADPPSAFPRRDRADSLDDALASLDAAGPDAEEQTTYARPASKPGPPHPDAARGGADAATDDDDLDIEIELDE